MLVLQTNQLSKSFGVTPILKNISIQIGQKDRVGLVGVNGAGKSTLLKIITGQYTADEGDLVWAKNATFGYLAQDSGLESDRTIWEEMKEVFSHLFSIEAELRRLEAEMGVDDVINHPSRYEKVMEEYARLSADFEEKGGFKYEASIRGVLHGLGFSDFPRDTPIHTLSGGQKTRLALGRLLLIQPDLLILDEPTNYLDIDTLSWLEGWLKGYEGALLIVSHDRYFLDALCTAIVEIERLQARTYKGNYTRYAAQKKEMLELQLKQYSQQQTEIAKLEDFVQKNIVRASTTKRAQSRRKQLEKIDRIDKPITETERSRFSFDIDRQSGMDVLEVSGLSVAFAERVLFEHVSFHVSREDRLALTGPNGIGKSTLLKVLTKQLEPRGGTVRYGTNVSIGYYDQEQTALTPEKRVIDELWDDYPHLNETEIRTLLGNFLFSNEDVFKRISDLSGGEKARVSLAKLMLKNANLLILDEPTNHLDIQSKEVLEDALIDYPGTIIFVSHDRYFLNKMSTKTIELSAAGTVSYLGNYEYMIEKKQEKAALAEAAALSAGQQAPTAAADTASSGKSQFLVDKDAARRERTRLRQIEKLEADIEKFEAEIKGHEEKLCDPDVYLDHVKAADTQNALDAARHALDAALEEWTALQE